MRKIILIAVLKILTTGLSAQHPVDIKIDDVRFRWSNDTSYLVFAEVANRLDSSIMVLRSQLAFPVSFPFAGEFSVYFVDDSSLNSKVGPDAISSGLLYSYEKIDPNRSKSIPLRLHSMIFKRPGSYKLKLKYSLQFTEGELAGRGIVESNPFTITLLQGKTEINF